jgi:YcxB-like protein
MINIITRLSVDDYIKVNYHMLYRKWAIKGMTGFGIFFILLSLFTLISGDFSWFLFVFGLFLTVGLRTQVYFAAKRTYKTDGRVSEKIEYLFDKEEITITGESFNSRLTWDKIYSVTENKDWVLIWQNRQIANVIPKRDIKDGELQALKDIVNSQSGLKNKLKK